MKDGPANMTDQLANLAELREEVRGLEEEEEEEEEEGLMRERSLQFSNLPMCPAFAGRARKADWQSWGQSRYWDGGLFEPGLVCVEGVTGCSWW